MVPKRIGFLVFDGVMALDVVGPMDAFASAQTPEAKGKPRPCYDVVTIGLTDRKVRTESGLQFLPSTTIKECPRLDTLIIPGGAGLRGLTQGAPIVRWINEQHKSFRRVACVCTGIFGLAPTGLLNGRKVTTHWRFADDLAQKFPCLKVDANSLFIKDGKYYTSAGVTAGIDLSLAMIEEDHGRTVALTVARELVVYMKRSGGQEQYSEPLRFQVDSKDPISELESWIAGHLEQDLSIRELASRCYLSERQFSRKFQSVFRKTPAQYVETMRLDEARSRLSISKGTIEQVGRSVGFRSDDSFRRAFERHFGVAPTIYRSRFASTASAPG